MALIIFDYDGVLMNSRPSWAHAFKKTSEKYGFDYTYDEIVGHFGPKTEKVLEELIDGDEKRVKEAKRFIDALLETEDVLSRSEATLEANSVIKTLKEKGHALVILTNGDRAFLEASLEYHNFDKSAFKELIPAEREKDTKPDAIKDLMERYNFSPDETYYVGDRGHDVTVAKNAGCKGIILVEHGWDSEENVKGQNPDEIIYSLNELPDIID
ncbi:MAG: HAD family hydrolase [Candidatus Undinarchaeales archaeon]